MLMREGTTSQQFQEQRLTRSRPVTSDRLKRDQYELDKGQADAKLRVMKYKNETSVEAKNDERFCQLQENLTKMVLKHRLTIEKTDSSPIAKGKALCLSKKPIKRNEKQKSSRSIIKQIMSDKSNNRGKSTNKAGLGHQPVNCDSE